MLKEAIRDCFEKNASPSARERRLERAERQWTQSLSKGHGRIEHRELVSTTALNGYLDWPGVRQVFVVRRSRVVKGKESVEEAYGITSLDRTQADAQRLLELVRGHWGIENGLFHIRDETFGEDACRVRTGHAPRFLAACRNLAIGILNRIGCANKAEGLRRHGARSLEAVALIRARLEH